MLRGVLYLCVSIFPCVLLWVCKFAFKCGNVGGANILVRVCLCICVRACAHRACIVCVSLVHTFYHHALCTLMSHYFSADDLYIPSASPAYRQGSTKRRFSLRVAETSNKR